MEELEKLQELEGLEKLVELEEIKKLEEVQEAEELEKLEEPKKEFGLSCEVFLRKCDISLYQNGNLAHRAQMGQKVSRACRARSS